MASLQNEKKGQHGFQPIRPPWVKLADFLEKCTACHHCIDVCEMHILVKGAGGYPEVDFTSGQRECNFCKACVNACQVDIFRSTDEVAWTHKVAIQANCLTQRYIECRSCEDHCESRAIRFKRRLGGVAVPQLDAEMCNGCGACLAGCPSQAIKITYDEE